MRPEPLDSLRLPALVLVSLALAAGCSGTSQQKPPTPVSESNHRWFPIDPAATHALHAVTRDGEVTCESCHPATNDSFTQFTCVDCHTHQQSITDQLHGGVDPSVDGGYVFDSVACVRCHPAGAEVPFDHVGITGGCATCHDVGGPFAALPVAGFTHPTMSGADCGACHSTKTWKDASGGPTGLSFDPARNISVPTWLPRYSGTTLAALSPQTLTLSMKMKHDSTQVDPRFFSACTNCHLDAATGVFFPGQFHSSLNYFNAQLDAGARVPVPTHCSDCHGDTEPVGFVGPFATAPARSPAGPEMKHDAVAWAAGAPTTTALVSKECGLCHVSPNLNTDATWSSHPADAGAALYHAALATAGVAGPTSCLDCHANSRPVTPLSSANATLSPASLTFDHAHPAAMGECADCHVKSTTTAFASWAGGRFHRTGDATPSTCLPCHAAERPTSTSGWVSTTYTQAPFDYGTNATGTTHGAGADCALCHAGPGTGAWGSTQNWVGGHFTHGPGTPSATTCIACHMSQRPDLQPGTTSSAMAALIGFDHSLNGTGECFGCHQATVVANTYAHYVNPGTGQLPNGDWQGGQSYPGNVFISSPTQFVKLNELALNRAAGTGLVTGMSAFTETLYNGMLHTSQALPPELDAGGIVSPDYGMCWHCHTNVDGGVTAYKDGKYHQALANYSDVPGGTVTPLPQPTGFCLDCHTQMLPTKVVEKDGGTLIPMDHGASFTGAVTLGGKAVSKVSQADCSVCHAAPPGGSWGSGVFHTKVGAAVPADCVGCHYPLMADGAKADVGVGTKAKMGHRSTQVSFQACESCHASALTNSKTAPPLVTRWQTGAYHGSLTAQPTGCRDCHVGSEPDAGVSTQGTVTYVLAKGGTASNGGQWMNHGAPTVVNKDCALCHLADAKKTGSAWSRATVFHTPTMTVTSCQECHGLTNGKGAVAGTNNNLPSGLVDSSTVTTASGDGGTGIAVGTKDQLTHLDLNVAGKDCDTCHTQVGASTVAGVQGQEWAKAAFHKNFGTASPLLANGTTARCSNCHLNVKPTAVFTLYDHTPLTAASGTQDCAACHSFPGTGTTAAPNWLGAKAVPTYIPVGGFTIPVPPATTAGTVQGGINNLPHPTLATGVTCTTCHPGATPGKNAIGYDHLSTLINKSCNACHEAGSNLVGTPWNNATGSATYNSAGTGAGDTRPFTLTDVTARYKSNNLKVSGGNHFFPTDCNECHVVPAGNGLVTTGTAYVTAWNFPHTTKNMKDPTTCTQCHGNNIPR